MYSIVYSPPRVNKPPPLIKYWPENQDKSINQKSRDTGYINKHKTRNTTWSHLGGDVGSDLVGDLEGHL